MKTVIAMLLIASAITIENVSCRLKCQLPAVKINAFWKTMDKPCITKMRDQVQEELTAAMTYLAMGAHFSRDTINRPGFAKFFFESASEEREHAIKIISYLLMRGELTSELAELIKDPRPLSNEWDNGVSALEHALELETKVTQKIRDIIKTCEGQDSANGDEDPVNDYNLVDYLSDDFLGEQYKGQRDLAGKISTLGKMMEHHGPLGEFLFDKKMLNGEPL